MSDGNTIWRESEGERGDASAARLARGFADLTVDAVAARSVMLADAWLGLGPIAMAPEPQGLVHA